MTQTLPKSEQTRQLERAIAQAEGLRALAAMLEDNPELSDDLDYPLRTVLVSVGCNENPREDVAAWARAALRAGASVAKDFDTQWAGVHISFGPLGLKVYAARAAVCEKVVTGTREVTEQIPDPAYLAEVPVVEVTRTVEDVEWRCAPLLAAGVDR